MLKDKNIETQSKKDRLVIGSKWVFLVDCYTKDDILHTNEKVIIHSVNKYHVSFEYDGHIDSMPIGQFLLCAEPKEESDE